MISEQSNPKFSKALGHYNSLVTQLFIAKPEVFGQMPEDFELVLLPVEDPEVSQYSLDLLNRRKHFELPVIYASIAKQSVTFLLPEAPLEVAFV
jgi:hypothetical protein